MTLSPTLHVQIPHVGPYRAQHKRDASAALRTALFLTSEGVGGFSRTMRRGHVTASGFVVSPDRKQVLLLHHRKLGRWLQPGGHCDGNTDVIAVARREIREETGMGDIRLVSNSIFDIDAHEIPARRNEPAHIHYDIRFLFEAMPSDGLVRNNESTAIEWVETSEMERLTGDPAVLVARRALTWAD
ncbi:NUDIX hydrolase [Salipiger mucosus]|uniref:Adenosylhomocysteinase n=1 Tax=Salipiger mucosus DSM 16094 TaxID=1123237 RepID=S9RVL5_9RHOB|nr:NUDIX hydrolase [Salipiger mucosus]EPX78019.1 Adenosylhomocysteinase [Salipiger mucosus DSM 16094]